MFVIEVSFVSECFVIVKKIDFYLYIFFLGNCLWFIFLDVI